LLLWGRVEAAKAAAAKLNDEKAQLLLLQSLWAARLRDVVGV
jgi:hypothetical protein